MGTSSMGSKDIETMANLGVLVIGEFGLGEDCDIGVEGLHGMEGLQKAHFHGQDHIVSSECDVCVGVGGSWRDWGRY